MLHKSQATKPIKKRQKNFFCSSLSRGEKQFSPFKCDSKCFCFSASSSLGTFFMIFHDSPSLSLPYFITSKLIFMYKRWISHSEWTHTSRLEREEGGGRNRWLSDADLSSEHQITVCRWPNRRTSPKATWKSLEMFSLPGPLFQCRFARDFLLFSAFSVPHPRSMSTVGVFGRRTAESRRLFLSCSVEFYDLMSRKTISRYSTSLLLSHSLSKVNSARSHGAEGKGKRRQIAI